MVPNLACTAAKAVRSQDHIFCWNLTASYLVFFCLELVQNKFSKGDYDKYGAIICFPVTCQQKNPFLTY